MKLVAAGVFALCGLMALVGTFGVMRFREAPHVGARAVRKGAGRRLLHEDVQDLIWEEELMSSSDFGHCDPSARVHEWVAAFNEKRFQAMGDMYTGDSLRFVNGKLDDLTNGKPYSVEDWKCLHKDAPKLQYHIGDVVSSGKSVAAVSGTFVVQRSMTGLAFVLEFDEDTCKIMTERLYGTSDSEAMRQFTRNYACGCFPVAEELGVCHQEAAAAEVDVAAVTEECWRHLVVGNAAEFAACFEPGVRGVTNGVRDDVDLSDALAVDGMLQQFRYQADIAHMLVEGFNVHAVVRVTVTAKALGESVDYYVYQSLHFNEEGKVSELVQVQDMGAVGPLMAKASGSAPMVRFWASEDAADALQHYVDELGFPADFTDRADALNMAVWEKAQMPAGRCFSSVKVEDRTFVHRQPTSHEVFAVASVRLNVGTQAAEMRMVSDSVVVDELTGTVYSYGANLGQHVVDLWLAARVAMGAMTAQEARAQYATRIQSTFDADGTLTQEYTNLLSQLCGMVA